MDITKTYLKDLVYQVNGAVIEVHRALGPGLLESVYQQCMNKELLVRRIQFNSQIMVPIDYKGTKLDSILRCDYVIENILIVELKAVEYVLPIHDAQILTYMKLMNFPIGLLINFNSTNIFHTGQKTFVNELYRNIPQ